MFSRRTTSILALVVFLTGGLIYGGCGSAKTSLGVVVSDHSGAPVSMAKVASLSQPEGQLPLTGITSKDNNKVTFKDVKAGLYEIQISATGYDSQIISITAGEGQEFVGRVYLNPTQSASSENIQGD